MRKKRIGTEREERMEEGGEESVTEYTVARELEANFGSTHCI